MLKNLAGSSLGIWSAHGEGKFSFPKEESAYKITAKYAYDAMGFHYGGDLLVRGKDQRGEMKKDDEILRKAVKFGKIIMLD